MGWKQLRFHLCSCVCSMTTVGRLDHNRSSVRLGCIHTCTVAIRPAKTQFNARCKGVSVIVTSQKIRPALVIILHKYCIRQKLNHPGFLLKLEADIRPAGACRDTCWTGGLENSSLVRKLRDVRNYIKYYHLAAILNSQIVSAGWRGLIHSSPTQMCGAGVVGGRSVQG